MPVFSEPNPIFDLSQGWVATAQNHRATRGRFSVSPVTDEQVVAKRGENSVTRYHQRGVNGSREVVKVLGKTGSKVDEHAQVER